MNTPPSEEKSLNRRTLIWLVIFIALQFGLFFLVKIAGVQNELFVYQLF